MPRTTNAGTRGGGGWPERVRLFLSFSFLYSFSYISIKGNTENIHVLCKYLHVLVTVQCTFPIIEKLQQRRLVQNGRSSCVRLDNTNIMM